MHCVNRAALLTCQCVRSPHFAFLGCGGLIDNNSIGAKFALTEMKVLLITVLARFQLAPEPGVTIRQHQALIVRPRVETSSGTSAAGMPLRVRRLPHKTLT